MGSVREKAIRGYIRHTPKIVRNYTDPVVRLGVRAQGEIKRRGVAGGKTVRGVVTKVTGIRRKTK